MYNNYRLIVHDSCISITGIMNSWETVEADGDIHLRVAVDAPFNYMINSENVSHEGGFLVVEPVCAEPISQPDAVSACVGFSNSVFIPAAGEHVKITGDYVTDNDHGWNEIHPVSSIEIVSGATGVGSAGLVAPEVTVFPNPATSAVNFRLSKKPSSLVLITISDEAGRLAGQFQMLEMMNLRVVSKYFPAGKYYYHVQQDAKTIGHGTFVIEH